MRNRLDIALVTLGYFESREKAQTAIKNGAVKINGNEVLRPSYSLDSSDIIAVAIPEDNFVSRGGNKLLKAVKYFDINFKDKVVMDIGASTGGFTDCALQFGAKTVFAIDVGNEQLHPSLKKDNRVISFEKTDIRNLTLNQVNNTPADLILADLSFISIKLVLPFFKKFLSENGEVIVLIKPQFETGGNVYMKNGIVKEENLRQEIIENLKTFIVQIGFSVEGIIPTDADGVSKNIEYLMWLKQKA